MSDIDDVSISDGIEDEDDEPYSDDDGTYFDEEDNSVQAKSKKSENQQSKSSAKETLKKSSPVKSKKARPPRNKEEIVIPDDESSSDGSESTATALEMLKKSSQVKSKKARPPRSEEEIVIPDDDISSDGSESTATALEMLKKSSQVKSKKLPRNKKEIEVHDDESSTDGSMFSAQEKLKVRNQVKSKKSNDLSTDRSKSAKSKASDEEDNSCEDMLTKSRVPRKKEARNRGKMNAVSKGIPGDDTSQKPSRKAKKDALDSIKENVEYERSQKRSRGPKIRRVSRQLPTRNTVSKYESYLKNTTEKHGNNPPSDSEVKMDEKEFKSFRDRRSFVDNDDDVLRKQDEARNNDSVLFHLSGTNHHLNAKNKTIADKRIKSLSTCKIVDKRKSIALLRREIEFASHHELYKFGHKKCLMSDSPSQDLRKAIFSVIYSNYEHQPKEDSSSTQGEEVEHQQLANMYENNFFRDIHELLLHDPRNEVYILFRRYVNIFRLRSFLF